MITQMLISIGILAGAVALGIFIYTKLGRSKISNASLEALRLIEEAKREAEKAFAGLPVRSVYAGGQASVKPRFM